jgi:SAM-dependent methyltransferase
MEPNHREHSSSIVGQRMFTDWHTKETTELVVIYCQHCRFRHLDPIPSTDIYSSGHFYSNIKPAYRDEYSQDGKWWKAIYGDWLSLVDPLAPNKILVDVGAGTGDFLNFALANKYSAVGLEPDTSMAEANSHIVNCGYADYIATDVGVISAHWVLEHFSDPVGFLQWAYKSLAPSGVLLITIPNDFSSIQETAAKKIDRPAYWLHPTHTNYWPALEFPSFLRRYNFTVQSVYGSWEPERYLLDGLIYLDDHKLGRHLHSERKRMDLDYSDEYRRRKYLLWGANGVGRDVTFCAIRQ